MLRDNFHTRGFAKECDCSSREKKGYVSPGADRAFPVQDISRAKTLLEAHERFGHRNFRSLAKALNLKLPAKLPFCKACAEAKATRHPRSRDPHPSRPLAVRAGARIYFDPFGPFRERLADGSYYAILFMDAFSTVLWLNTLSALKDWFGCLERLINRLESEKGSVRVVSELACDSAPMFKRSTQLLNYTDKKGIVLLHSPPYTQKFNMVERSIRTVGEMGLAMARHANTPVPFMCYALMFATKLLNRLHRTMPDGTIDVPLWRFKGVKVPLNLDRFHPFGCAVEAVLPKHSQARFAPKTVSCIFLGFDDNSLSYVLARLPNYGILHTAHAIFNDGDFPCRRLVAANWPMGGAYDEHAEDPLSHWLGDGRHLALVMLGNRSFRWEVTTCQPLNLVWDQHRRLFDRG